MQPSEPAQPDRLAARVQADGVRLDRAVADWRGLSRAAVLRLLAHGVVTCNRRVMSRANKGDLLHAGDQIGLDSAFAGGETPLPDASVELDILQQGEGWLVVNKPAGLPVRPHALDEQSTLLSGVVAEYPEVVGVGEGGLRSGIVHRLDTDTSGALLIATRQDAWQELREAFSQHLITKRYLALVEGGIVDRGAASRDLRVATHQPAFVEVVRAGGGAVDARACSLAWRVIERFDGRASLVDIDLHTGFLHQVRVMMADLGHPVVGDRVYGEVQPGVTAPRQMLHASTLVYKEIDIKAPLPIDMSNLREALRDTQA
ncbi:MAG: RluA family pseudouridine synthase [Planctomycetota bacterium]